MNEQSITIRWDKNPDGSIDISVSGDKDYLPHFKEAFLSLDTFPSVHSVDERETSGDSAGNSATIALLTQLIAIIRKVIKRVVRLYRNKCLIPNFHLQIW